MSETQLIAGLGNPGVKYQQTRHNLGFLVVAQLADRYRLKFFEKSAVKGLLAQGEIEGVKAKLLLPMTFMNNSGVSVAHAVKEYGVSPEKLLVVCDDFHLDFGQLRIKAEGGGGGHNGLKSIIDILQIRSFPRLRVGIGSPTDKNEISEYVLDKFKTAERQKLSEIVEKAADCCVSWVKDGTEKTMSQYNKRMVYE